MPSRSGGRCTPSVGCACSNYPSPSFPFLSTRLLGGELLGYAVTTIPPLSRDVSALLGLEPPLLVLPAARKCGRRGRWRRKGRELSAPGPGRGRGKVRRLRRKCQRKWVLCRDGSVGWLRKRSPSTPERGTVYVSLHT